MGVGDAPQPQNTLPSQPRKDIREFVDPNKLPNLAVFFLYIIFIIDKKHIRKNRLLIFLRVGFSDLHSSLIPSLVFDSSCLLHFFGCMMFLYIPTRN